VNDGLNGRQTLFWFARKYGPELPVCPSSAQNSKQKNSSDVLHGSVDESYGDLATTEIYYAPFRMNPDPKNGNSWDGFLRTKQAMLLQFRVLGFDIHLTGDGYILVEKKATNRLPRQQTSSR
jgi:hypothetical protein